MTVKVQGYPKFKAFVPATNSLAVGYQLFTYEPGTTTKKTTYQDYAKSTANTNPIILDSNGECFLVLDGLTKLVLAPDNDTDPPASPTWTFDNVGEADTSASSIGVWNKIPNGSFETDTDGDGTPDDWVFVAGTSNTMTIVETTNWHADSCLEVVIASANTAVATTTLFEVAEGSEEVFRWAMKASAANASVVARVKWYDKDEVFISNSDIYSNSSTNPTSWTDKFAKVTVPSTARYAKFELRTATSGVTVNYDNVRNFALEFNDVAMTMTGLWSFDNGITQFGSGAPADNWPSSYDVLEIGATGSVATSGANLNLSENTYFDDTDSRWEYQNTGEASRIQLAAGEVSLFVAASGTADTAVTFKEFVVESGGTVKNLAGNFLNSPDGTDITPSHELSMYLSGASDTPAIVFQNSTTGVTSSDGSLIGLDASANLVINNQETQHISFYTGGSYVGKIANGGNWVIFDSDITPNNELVIYRDGISGAPALSFQNSTTGTAASDGFLLGINANEEGVINNQENTDLLFYTNNSFVGKIYATGEWLLSDSDITPAYDLVLYDSGLAGSTLFQFLNDGTGATSGDGTYIGLDASENFNIQNQESTDIGFYTAGAFAGKIDSSLFWLIGDSDITPAYELTLYQSGVGSDTVVQLLNDGTGATSGDGTTLGLGTSEEFNIVNRESTDIAFYTASTFRGKIDAGGYWSIGDTSITPAHELTIYESGASGTPSVVFQNATTGVTSSDGSLIGLDASENFSISQQESADMIFYTASAFAGKIGSARDWLIGDADITPPDLLTLYQSSVSGSAVLQMVNGTSGITGTDGLEVGLYGSSTNALIWQQENAELQFGVNSTLAGKFEPSGEFLHTVDGTDITPSRSFIHYDATVAGEYYLQIINDGTGSTSGDGFLLGISTSEEVQLINQENTDLNFFTNNSFAGKIANSGEWLIASSDITPNHELVIYSSGVNDTPAIAFQNGTTNTTATDGSIIGLDSSSHLQINNQEAGEVYIYTNNAFTARFSSGHKLLVGDTDASPSYEFVAYDATVGSTSYIQFINDGTGALSGDGLLVGINAVEEAVINNQEATDMLFYNGGTLMGVWESNGHLAITDLDLTAQSELTLYEDGIGGSPGINFQNGTTGAVSTSQGGEITLTSAEDLQISSHSGDLILGSSSVSIRMPASGTDVLISATDITPSYDLVLYAAGSTTHSFQMINGDTNSNSGDGFLILQEATTTDVSLRQLEAADLEFYTSNTYRGGFEASGGFIVGNTSTVTPPGNDTILSYESSVSGTNGLAVQSGGTGNTTSDGLFLGLDVDENIIFNNAEANDTDFQVGGTSRFFIASDGGVVVGTSSASSNGAGTLYVTNSLECSNVTTGRSGSLFSGANSNISSDTVFLQASNASYSGSVLRLDCARTASASYYFIEARSDYDGTPDTEFSVDGAGTVSGDGASYNTPADYAEMFEWSDGNPNNEDRVGISVVLEGKKIREATDQDDPNSIIGVISGNPAVVADSCWSRWEQKYLKDDFNRYIISEEGNKQVNPHYDPNKKYKARKDRPEWDAVGLVGKLSVKQGQQIGKHWIKMEEISPTVTRYLVR